MGTSRAPATGSILVYIRAEDGRPYSGVPQINLIVEESTQNLVQTPRMTGNAWAFSGLATGMSYEVEVTADGYQVARQTVLIPDIDGGSASVMIFLRPRDSRLDFHPPGGHFLLAPRAQKEVEKGLKDINAGKFPSAQKHFQKALEMAPGNPYVNYLMGMSYLLAKQLTSARPYLEKSVSVDPSQAPSLTALGTLRFDEGDYPGAIQVLSKAVQADSSSWKSQWILSASYLKQRDYKPARDHALAALAASKGKATEVELLLAQALAGLGDREGALKAVQSFLSAHPNASPQIRGWAEELRQAPPAEPKSAVMKVAERPATTTASPVEPVRTIVTVIPPPIPELPPDKDWAPPDIDAAKHFVIPEATCSLPKILRTARKSAVQFVDTLQKFSATEEYQSVEVKRNKSLEKPEFGTYSYLATIEAPRSGTIPVTEYRNQSASEEQMPGKLNDIGAPALALVFHPVYKDDFRWSCEGLGEWEGKTAWIIRFEQRPDRPATLAALQASSGTYSLPFKGLAWVGNSGQVIHAEFDLVKPIKQAELYREHFSLDYKPITFKNHRVTLWLPENVNVYYQYRGHYLHHYHHFSNFQLFWTGASEKVGQPVEAGDKKSD
ncbi:MAG TPA: tetratricopeptide repeat protein [Candidatus Acidoferrales bacterium]|nr:tetratricopeptide repeat protein [Candidatus Acidoferrales bacterium]